MIQVKFGFNTLDTLAPLMMGAELGTGIFVDYISVNDRNYLVTENQDEDKEINVRELKDNFVKMISDDWALLTAGKADDFNTMTVSWGGIGELWGKDVCFVFVRPQRYTYEFLEKEEYFTLSFYGGEFKDALKICGSKSGRDINKAEVCGFTPVFTDGAVTFEQAEYTLVCRKMASQFIDPKGFEDENIEKNYAAKDYHKVYIGEILKVYAK